MLKEYLADRGISTYSLAKKSSVPYSTVNDLVNNKINAKNMKAGVLHSLSATLGLTMDELYSICGNEAAIRSERYGVTGTLYTENKKYFLAFEYGGKRYSRELYPVRARTTKYIDTIAQWTLDSMMSDVIMEEMYALYSEKKR